ncbi:MAG: radical SAM protein [Nanoarchaeota archaeon]
MTTEETKELYEAKAKYYDNYYCSILYKNCAEELKNILSKLPKKYNSILELGCGTGISTLAIVGSRHYPEIVSVDISKEMIDRAKFKICDYLGEPQRLKELVSFINGDAKKLNLGRKFNCLVYPYSIHCLGMKGFENSIKHLDDDDGFIVIYGIKLKNKIKSNFISNLFSSHPELFDNVKDENISLDNILEVFHKNNIGELDVEELIFDYPENLELTAEGVAISLLGKGIFGHNQYQFTDKEEKIIIDFTRKWMTPLTKEKEEDLKQIIAGDTLFIKGYKKQSLGHKHRNNDNMLVQWHVTTKCQNKCKHCYVWDERTYKEECKNEMTFEQARTILKDIAKYSKNNFSINFSGGDPLLCDWFLDLVKEAKLLGGKRLGILGNPDLLDLDMCKRIKEVGIDHLQVSLEGDKETHDSIRRPGSFNLIEPAIKNLKEVGIESAIMFTLSAQNKNKLYDAMEWSAKWGVGVFAWARCSPVGHGATIDEKEEIISPGEFRDILVKYLEYELIIQEKYPECKTKFARKEHLFKPLYDELGLPWIDLVGRGCGISNKMLVILADGTTMGCRRAPLISGNIIKENIKDILGGECYNLWNDWSKIEGCGTCKYIGCCRGCRAVAYGSTGNYFSNDPQCWLANKEK